MYTSREPGYTELQTILHLGNTQDSFRVQDADWLSTVPQTLIVTCTQ